MKRLATVGAVGVVLAGSAVLGLAEGEAAPAVSCTFFRVHSADVWGFSVLSRVNLANTAAQRIATLDYRVNAIAYSEDTNSLWGLSTRSTSGVFGDGAHVVSIGTDGDVIDHGPVRRVNELAFPNDWFTTATAGTIVGNELVVRVDAAIYRIDLDPASNTYLGVVDAVMTHPGGQVSNVDDFDVRNGVAYGVAADYSRSRVVRIDLRTGQVTRVETTGLPGSASYGVALLAPDGALYAAANRIGDRSPVYRIDLGTGVATEVGSWPPVASADATACLPGVEPATTPQPTPQTPPPAPAPPRPPQRPAPVAIPPSPPVISPTPIPVVPPPPVVPTTAAPPPAAPPVTAASTKRPYRPQPTTPTEEPRTTRRASNPTEEKRQWGLTVMVLVVGAGAAAAAGRRRRR
ncbi:DUF6923 family protein [Actinokineospora globicatena]|uniref:DUF6923 family protein n=1 Tax=Actinokineospora globicatena TaxID=103729 RepID=UPI0020A23E32|nr:hypothetical protein [Actinokineospora globicatena]MCP2305060.1 hypothetical protein [Actinokineospora globicatena]GLW80525.1 hypothetical protein Aglo01_50060 [Actinokineospora globicatena]GLW87353.1 hypothetical protein Aglo02_49920 [Actinokineospora globicatena]